VQTRIHFRLMIVEQILPDDSEVQYLMLATCASGDGEDATAPGAIARAAATAETRASLRTGTR
jgi:hypothetical protein